MSYEEKIKAVLSQVDLGKPSFILRVSNSAIRPVSADWKPNIDDNGEFFNDMTRPHIYRSFSSSSNSYYLDTTDIINRVKDSVVRNAVNLFVETSPAKEPKRTTAYKSFMKVFNENRSKIDFINAMFDIAEYHYKVTATDSIKSKSNDVHRKNIYQLLCLMEKNYGQTKKNSDF